MSFDFKMPFILATEYPSLNTSLSDVTELIMAPWKMDASTVMCHDIWKHFESQVHRQSLHLSNVFEGKGGVSFNKAVDC